jgi:translation initiation factor 2B subunit (eIF-2B alpha/beta/delta family)
MTLEEKIESIRNDQVHGAAFLAREAIRTLIACVEQCPAQGREQLRDDFLASARVLLAVRPSMPAIGHLVVRATELARDQYLNEFDPPELKGNILVALQQLLARCRQAHQEAVQHAADFLKDRSVILTLSFSSNVQDALLRAAKKIKMVYVAETRPLFEGRQLAEILAKAGIPVTLLTDAAMGRALDKASLCLINKTGSYFLALAARERKTPFYPICETHKYHVGAVPFELEAKDPGDVCAPIPGVQIPNQPFEVVPPRLIQGYITEFGVISPHLAVQQILTWQRQLTGKKLFGDWKTATS